MSSNSLSEHLSFNYHSLYPTLLFAPTIAVSFVDSPDLGLITAAAGLASNLISHKITKISLEKGWDDGSRICIVFLSTLSIYTLAAAAIALLNVPGAIVCLAVGAGVSLTNAIFEENSVQEARKKLKNHQDWTEAQKALTDYVALYEDYGKLVKINYASSPASILNGGYNKPEWGTFFLKLVEDEKSNIVKLIAGRKRQSLALEISRKIQHYESLWDKLNKNPSHVDSLLNPDEFSEKLHQKAKNMEGLEALAVLVDESLKNIQTRFEELKIAYPSMI